MDGESAMGKVIELAKKKQELLEDKVGEKEQKQIVEDIQYLTRLADPDFQGGIPCTLISPRPTWRCCVARA